MPSGEELALLIPIIAVSIPIVAIITSHQRKVLELKLRLKGEVPNEIKSELTELKTQLAQLRDTTTKFDMSFDAAISRLEDRMDKVDERHFTEGYGNTASAATTTTSAAPYGAPTPEQNTVTLGQGR